MSGERRATALVTGAGRRIGASLARHLGARGLEVLVHVNRSRREGEATVGAIRAAGGAAHLVAADLGDPSALGALADACGPEPLALLVHNASVFAHDLPDAPDPALLEASLAVHVRAPFHLLAALIAAGRPPRTIVAILDQKLGNLNPDYFSYTIGKAGLEAMVAMLIQRPPPGCRVFGVRLGTTSGSADLDEAALAASRADTPLGRSSTPADLARLLDLILEAPDLPGQILVLDGGESLRPRARDVAFDPSLAQPPRAG